MDNHEMLQEIAKMMAAQEARMDSKFNAILTQVGQTTSEIVLSVGEQFDHYNERLKDFKEEIVREVRALTENIEGKKIRVLADESQAHKETLDDHEQRIEHLEKVSV